LKQTAPHKPPAIFVLVILTTLISVFVALLTVTTQSAIISTSTSQARVAAAVGASVWVPSALPTLFSKAKDQQ